MTPNRALGRRGRWAVIVPSTNTVVEHDFNMIGPRGITFHAGRIRITATALSSDEEFEAFLRNVRAEIDEAVRVVMTCQPDHLVMGMSAETFWDGAEGNSRFMARMREVSGLNVTTGASAVRAALECYSVRRVAAITPYQPVVDRQVQRFLTESGYDVVRVTGLRCESATSIASVSNDDLIRVLQAVDSPEVDAIVQVGTNLSMVRLAAEAEHWLGKPVVAINAATLWHALRTNGLDDTFDDFGSLLRDH